MSKPYRVKNWLALVIFPALASYGCGEAESAGKKSINISQSAKPVHHRVEIKQMMFVPADLVVNSGDTITFINLDMVEHDVTEQKEKKWASPKLTTGMQFTRVFHESTSYFCSIHPVMTGRIIIE